MEIEAMLSRLRAALAERPEELAAIEEGVAGLAARAEELAGQLVATQEELATTQRAIEEPGGLRAQLAEVTTRADQFAEAGVHVVQKYRTLALAAYPDLPEELIGGTTVEAVDASIEAARKVVEKVQAALAARLTSAPVPNGAPARTGPDLAALSPRDKIAYGLMNGR